MIRKRKVILIPIVSFSVLFLVLSKSSISGEIDCLYNIDAINPAYLHDKEFKKVDWDDKLKKAIVLTKDNAEVIVQYSACQHLGVNIEYITTFSTDEKLYTREVTRQLTWLTKKFFTQDESDFVMNYLDSRQARDVLKKLPMEKRVAFVPEGEVFEEMLIVVKLIEDKISIKIEAYD